MNLYWWKSEALEDYLEGDIIVMASSVEKAKKLVMEKARKEFAHDPRKIKQFKKDINDYEPDIIEDKTMFIYGSS